MKDVKIAKSDPAVYNKKFWCSLKQKYPFVMSNQDITWFLFCVKKNYGLGRRTPTKKV